MLDSHVYMDDSFNGIVGGMGVCTVLLGNQCNPSSDDNVSIEGGSGEMLSWGFSQSIAEITLEMGDDSHFDFSFGSFEYNIGSGWLSATTDTNGMATLLLGGSGQIDFRAAGNEVSDHFYIRNASTTEVPVPAAVWLFGSGLIGLAGLARRKT
jgi:hypothetical protein